MKKILIISLCFLLPLGLFSRENDQPEKSPDTSELLDKEISDDSGESKEEEAPSYTEDIFRFKYQKDDKHKITSLIDQKVYLDGDLHHETGMTKRGSMEITGFKDGKAQIERSWYISENVREKKDAASWTAEYHVSYLQDDLGNQDIHQDYYMPLLRQVPRFPNRPVRLGETWKDEAFEVHDFRYYFNIDQSVQIKFTVYYTYAKVKDIDGKRHAEIEIEYHYNHNLSEELQKGKLYPKRLTGSSKQLLLWNIDDGRPLSTQEEFSFLMDLSNGQSWDFNGKRNTAFKLKRIQKAKEEVAREIQQEISQMKDEEGGDQMENIEVKTEESGITISVENIRFMPNSDELIPAEKQKLKKIGDILKKFPDRDILITGHTALAGTFRDRKELSTQRAMSVARFFTEEGVRRREQMIVKGLGAQKPVADNSTAEGRARNRRVEITLVDD